MPDIEAEKRALRELIVNWVIWRDAGWWEKFRTVWHDDGVMMATWFQGTADEFIQVSKEGWEKGVMIRPLPRRNHRRGRRRACDHSDQDDDLAARAG